MEVPEGLNATSSPTTDSDTESLELAQVYCSAVTNRGPVAPVQRPHRPVFDRSANGTVVSPVECNANQPVRVPALVPNIRVSNFGVGLPNQTTIAKPTVTDSSFMKDDREKPRDLKHALKYSLNLCDGNTPITEVTGERKEILNEVMEKCFQNTNAIRQHLEYLNNDELYKSPSESWNIMESLQSIEMDVELTDQAIYFCKLSGMEILSRYLFCDTIEFRIVALNILATVVQNNPYGMEEALRQGMLEMLLKDLKKIAGVSDPKNPSEPLETLPDAVAVKTLYATSCLLRGNQKGCQAFKENLGFNFTLRILAVHQNPKVLKKTYYIILSIIADEIEKGGDVDVSHIENEDWKYYLAMIVERFGGREDSIAVAVSLAQVLEEIISRYHGHSEQLQIRSLLKEKGATLTVQTYLNNIDDAAVLELSQDEIEMLKTCQALKKFIESTD